MKKMNNKGFSLVELIVVIAIMAVLVGVLAPQFIKYVEKSRQSTDVTNLDSIKTVVESYYADKESVAAYISILPVTSGTSTVYKVYEGAAEYAATTEATKAVQQGGVQNTPVKGKWKIGNTNGTMPRATWSTATNEWKYSASSDYYGVDASGKIVTE